MNKKLDGQNITEILQGKSEVHPPVFSMHNDEIMSIRKGNMKLFVNKPKGRRAFDLKTWSDPRGPDGTTIIAQLEQATPADYPGVIPEKPKNNIQLFDVKVDPTESNDLSKERPELVQELLRACKEFEESLNFGE